MLDIHANGGSGSDVDGQLHSELLCSFLPQFFVNDLNFVVKSLVDNRDETSPAAVGNLLRILLQKVMKHTRSPSRYVDAFAIADVVEKELKSAVKLVVDGMNAAEMRQLLDGLAKKIGGLNPCL